MNHLFRLLSLLAIAALLCLPSCVSSGNASDFGLVSRATVGSPPDASEPHLDGIVAWDGDTLLAGGWFGGSVGVFLRDTGAYIYPPREFSDGAAVVRVKSTGFEWKGKWGEPLPVEAKFAFRPGEAKLWGVRFQDEL